MAVEPTATLTPDTLLYPDDLLYPGAGVLVPIPEDPPPVPDPPPDPPPDPTPTPEPAAPLLDQLDALLTSLAVLLTEKLADLAAAQAGGDRATMDQAADEVTATRQVIRDITRARALASRLV